jgi:hypothetical protein
MTDFDLSYYLISAGFIVALNLVVFTSFRASYSNNKKAYLALASWAVVVEALRQLPDNFLVLYPDSNILYVVSALIQFGASLTFLIAINLMDGECSNRNKAQACGFITFLSYALQPSY